jgi:HAD superfamily hydrolase (TIGR01490 family)
MHAKRDFDGGSAVAKTSSAFFDLDNTLIRGSSFYYFVKGLVAHGIISRTQIAKFSMANYQYIRSRQERPHAITEVTRRALHFIQGLSQNFLKGLSREIVREFLPKRLVPVMRERVFEHQLVGNDTWLVTAAPQELAEDIALELGMTGAIGTRARVHNGHYRAELEGPTMHGAEKARVLRAIALHRGYNLQASFAYSDSFNDLPMLVTAGRPFLVNPDKELARLGMKNSWPIIETAKDFHAIP